MNHLDLETGISTIKEEGIKAVLGSDELKALLQGIASQVLDGPAADIAASIIGSAAPMVSSFYLTYKQKRFERNINGY